MTINNIVGVEIGGACGRRDEPRHERTALDADRRVPPSKRHSPRPAPELVVDEAVCRGRRGLPAKLRSEDVLRDDVADTHSADVADDEGVVEHHDRRRLG